MRREAEGQKSWEGGGREGGRREGGMLEVVAEKQEEFLERLNRS